MKKDNERYSEVVVKRGIILDLANVKKTYKKYSKGIGEFKLDKLSSDDLLLHLVRVGAIKESKTRRYFEDDPFLEFNLLDNLYDIEFHIKDKKEKAFSISAENYLLAKIMRPFASLGIPQHKKYELSQQLRYNINEVFYNKSFNGYMGLDYLKEYKNTMIYEYLYAFIKYNRNVKYCRADELMKHGYDFVKKDSVMNFFESRIRNIYYKEDKTKNHILFYLLYLTVYEGIELHLIYDHSAPVDCFIITEQKGSKKYINNGCSILSLYDILINAFNVFGTTDKPVASKTKAWNLVINDIIEASEKSITFTYSLSGSNGLPMMGEIGFIHTDLSKFDELKEYAGDFGGVIPMQGTKDKKILDGKKKLNYKKQRKVSQNLNSQ